MPLEVLLEIVLYFKVNLYILHVFPVFSQRATAFVTSCDVALSKRVLLLKEEFATREANCFQVGNKLSLSRSLLRKEAKKKISELLPLEVCPFTLR